MGRLAAALAVVNERKALVVGGERGVKAGPGNATAPAHPEFEPHPGVSGRAIETAASVIAEQPCASSAPRRKTWPSSRPQLCRGSTVVPKPTKPRVSAAPPGEDSRSRRPYGSEPHGPRLQ